LPIEGWSFASDEKYDVIFDGELSLKDERRRVQFQKAIPIVQT